MRARAILCAVLLIRAVAAAGAETPLPHHELPHHDITVRLDPAARDLMVTDRIAIAGSGTATFALAPNFVVTGVSVDGRAVAHGRDGGLLRVDLGRPGGHRLVITYRGRLGRLGDGPPGPPPYPPLASPRGSYLPGAADWYPRTGGTPFTYRATIEVPEPQRAVMPGRLVEETVAGGRYRAVFESEVPTWSMVLMAGPYAIDERWRDGVRLRTYFDPEIAHLAGDYLDSTAAYIDRYSAWIGAYPYSAFHVVSSPLPVGLGHTNLTYMGTRVLALPFIRASSLGHEVLHDWWGNGVHVAGGGNWSEGLTTFMADYTYALERGRAEAREMRLGWLRDYAALPAGRDRAAVDFAGKTHDASQVIGYNKVAFFFHMLRRKLGSRTFDAGIRRFWREHRFRAAAWSDLRRAFEAAAGRRLDRFFRQWLERPGAPRLALGPVTTTGEGPFRTTITVRQSAPPYALEIPGRLLTAAGEQAFTVRMEGTRASIDIDTAQRPLEVTVDPDFDIFRRLDAAETPPILRDVTLDSRTRVVVPADGAARAIARRLAARLLDARPLFADDPAAIPPNAPVLVVGIGDGMLEVLAGAGLPGVPDRLAGQGTARVWAARADGRSLLAVQADNVAALEALLRPLPHYGRDGYLVFEGARARDRGRWPAGRGPLSVRLD